MGIFSLNWLADLLLRLPGVLWALSFHEFCHGWAAHMLGDDTAARSGRLSINPLDHLDPIGTLMLVVLRFGWARPVPIDSRYFKRPRRDIAIVSAAGAAGNFLSALVLAVVFNMFPSLLDAGALRDVLVHALYINIGLGVFNLIPIPPLDGSKVLAVMLPPSALGSYLMLERFGMLLILLLSSLGVIQLIMHPLMSVAVRSILWLSSLPFRSI